MSELAPLLRALLLASDRPLTASAVVELIDGAVDEEEWPERVDADAVEAALEALAAEHDAASGLELFCAAGGWRLRTAPTLSNMVRRLFPTRAIRLSRAALEALSVVAYRQPCTRVEVEEVRGVDCGGVLKSLLERRLVRVVGRKDEPGRPLLYGTTPAFLERLGLDHLGELPSLGGFVPDADVVETLELALRADGPEGGAENAVDA